MDLRAVTCYSVRQPATHSSASDCTPRSGPGTARPGTPRRHLTPDHHGRYTVTQGGPHRLWDTLEAAHTTWRRLGTPGIEKFGITAHNERYTQHAWFDHPDSGYRWPLPL
jgi:hypothetical protein